LLLTYCGNPIQAKPEYYFGGELEIDFIHQQREFESSNKKLTDTYLSGEGKWNFTVQNIIDTWMTEARVGAMYTPEGEVETEDLYLKFGRVNQWDIAAGRFEAWDIYSLGEDVVVNAIGQEIFTVEEAKGRDGGGLFGHFYHGNATFQMNIITSSETITDPETDDDIDFNKLGLRPAVKMEFDRWNFTIGYERVTLRANDSTINYERTENNLGGHIEFQYKSTEFGFSVGQQKKTGRDFSNVDIAEIDQNSIGLYANHALKSGNEISVGYHFNTLEEGQTLITETKDKVGFLVYSVPLDDASKIQFAVSHGTADQKISSGPTQPIGKDLSYVVRFYHSLDDSLGKD